MSRGRLIADDVPVLVRRLVEAELQAAEFLRPLTPSARGLSPISGIAEVRSRRVALAAVDEGLLVRFMVGGRVRYRLPVQVVEQYLEAAETG